MSNCNPVKQQNNKQSSWPKREKFGAKIFWRPVMLRGSWGVLIRYAKIFTSRELWELSQENSGVS